jgi:hypothetical protein
MLPTAGDDRGLRADRSRVGNEGDQHALSRLVHGRPQKSEVESCEHQDNANIHRQSLPDSVSEEHEIYTDYDGRHRHHVKYDGLSAH